jgi:hypothetical protein
LMTFWVREREKKRGDKGGNVLLRYFFIDHFDYILTTFWHTENYNRGNEGVNVLFHFISSRILTTFLFRTK